MSTMTLEDVAKYVAADAFVAEDAFAIDPATIAAIIAIISQLIPMIKNCRNANETVEQAAVRLAKRLQRPRAVLLRWRYYRIVGEKLGRFAEDKMVEDVGNAILRITEDQSQLAAVCA